MTAQSTKTFFQYFHYGIICSYGEKNINMARKNVKTTLIYVSLLYCDRPITYARTKSVGAAGKE